ncbi:hypothetical protein [Sorangium sp. So ce693]|uniref:hypothetical protein n=1 Tax=Sorangium sp. So ce693 TaxID=3133318 RepID=UPI003F63ED5B
MRTKAFIERAMLRAVALLALPALGACGAETPPYDDLPLRDALSAAPEVLAALPEEVLHDVAVRLEEAHGEQGDETAIDGAEIASVPALVRSADAARDELGKDAVVLGALEPSEDGFVLRSVTAVAAGRGPEGPLDRPAPALAGQAASPETAPLEEAALGGRAGEILAELARRADAHDVVRVTGLPAGVIAQDHTVYVNAAWLVALSALSPKDAPALPAPAGGAAMPAWPRSEPRSVRINPYHLPSSVAECAAEVRDVCTCAVAGQCEHDRTDPTFADAQAECSWVNAGALNAEALCVLALLSIDGVKECVLSAGSGACAALPIAGRDGATAFAGDEGCMAVLDRCLQYGSPTVPAVTPSAPSGTSGGDGCGSCGGGCDGCNEDVSGCNQNCSDCNQNCHDCNQNCRDCNQNCKDGDPSTGSNSSCKLSAGRRDPGGGHPGAPVPLGAAFWLLLPAGYMLLHIRRRP